MYHIIKATQNELEPLSRLFDQYRVFYNKEADWEAAKSFLSERLANNDASIFVCLNEEKKVVGFVQLYPLFSSTRMQKLWLLNDLYVDEKYRGQGYAVALINKAKEFCKDTRACGLMLETARDNIIGNKLYPKTGFNLDTENNFYHWSANSNLDNSNETQ